MAETGANVVVSFVPPPAAKVGMMEAIDSGIALAVVITEGIPVHDTTAAWAYATSRGNVTRIIGPNCPGIASPGQSNAGIIPADITKPGRIGLVSKSGTLTYQMMFELRDIGFSTCVGIGGDPVVGTTHIDCLRAFQDDPDTDAIVMIGEIGGDAEERAAAFIESYVTKPVVGYVAGFTAPEGKTMGHAGAIVSGSSGTAAAKKGSPRKGRRAGRQDAERNCAAYARTHDRCGNRARLGRWTAPCITAPRPDSSFQQCTACRNRSPVGSCFRRLHGSLLARHFHGTTVAVTSRGGWAHARLRPEADQP